MKKVVCIEDDKNVLFFLESFLKSEGYEPVCFDDPVVALKHLKNHEEEYPLIITDVKMPVIDGIKLLEEIRKEGIKSSVIVITAYGEIEDAVRAMRLGATSYLQKPLKAEELVVHIEKAFQEYNNKLELENLKERVEEIEERNFLSIRSLKMRKILTLARKAAKSDAPIYITGESGVGKEVIARFIHRNSFRNKGPFITLDCGAIPETLLENELFGHVKGAFTGATSYKKGLFELADKGTLFLDELTNAPLNIQAKLLRAIETKTFMPLGSTEYKTSDVRIIAASLLPPEEALKRGKLREDLYYRLKVFLIEIPPLRERREDILPLARHFINELEKKYKKGIKSITREAIEILVNHSWPGNVRELKNVIEYAYIMAEKNKIEAKHIPLQIILNETKNLDVNYKKAKEQFEKIYFLKLLENSGYNINRASKLSGLSRQLIYNKLKKYKLPFKK